MPNDAKLGFLVGVVGVLAAGVLFFQTPPPAGTAVPAPAAVAASVTSPPAVTPAPSDPADSASTPVIPVSIRGRKEIAGAPVSRVNRDDE